MPLDSILCRFLDQPPKLIQRFTKTSDVIVVPGAMNSVNKIRLRSQSTYLTAGRSGDDSVHVLSVITPKLRSENV